MQDHVISEGNSCVFHRHPSRPVLLCEEDHCVFVDFFVLYSMRCKGSNNPSKEHNSAVIHKRYGESKIQVVVLPPKGHKANKAKQINSYGKKMREMASSCPLRHVSEKHK